MQYQGKTSLFFLVLIFALGQAGCDPRTGGGETRDAGEVTHPIEDAHAAPRVAVAHLEPTEGHETSGIVTFTEVEDGIHVTVNLTGLGDGPAKRGFHIHEKGDCSAPDATSAGGHFNPADKPHGPPDASDRHAGDFGNLDVDEDGTARADFVDAEITFDGPHSIVGRAVIVHAQEDDLETQPTGDAGARAACGVIELVENED